MVREPDHLSSARSSRRPDSCASSCVRPLCINDANTALILRVHSPSVCLPVSSLRCSADLGGVFFSRLRKMRSLFCYARASRYADICLVEVTCIIYKHVRCARICDLMIAMSAMHPLCFSFYGRYLEVFPPALREKGSRLRVLSSEIVSNSPLLL